MNPAFSSLFYLIASFCFIMALKGLSSAATSRSGNFYGAIGMAIAILTTLLSYPLSGYRYVFVALVVGGVLGTVLAKRLKMTALPQLVAGFHSLVGLAAVLVALAAFYSPDAFGIGKADEIPLSNLIEMGLGALIGAITFTGSLVAFGKLQGLIKSKPFLFPGQHHMNAFLAMALICLLILFVLSGAGFLSSFWLWLLILGAFVLGVLVIIPIGGADMPVVISMLNSYSGWAAAGIGFTLSNPLLIITGALVGSSGAILSHIMCKSMNRSILNVILGGFGSEAGESVAASNNEQGPAKISSPEDAAFVLSNARSVIIVPGYGMAVAHAQHALQEMTQLLEEQNVSVKYAIHPVAGRMPGHMNVLLAEAQVPYERVFELEDINSEFAATDVVFVIGANDITNPAAKTNKASPIYGMPILEVEKAKTVLFVKRSLAPGYAGVDNELFYRENTLMILGDAKKVCEALVRHLKES